MGREVNASKVVRVPGDKSISHRALIFASLASGTSRVRGLLESLDVRSTAGALRAMGREVPDPAPEVLITGQGLTGIGPVNATVQCGNSGTTARLLAGVSAAQAGSFTFDGDESLRARPMRRVTDPLAGMGARVEWLASAGLLPLRITGAPRRLRELRYEMPHASAQVKSAILLAGLCGGVKVAIREPQPSRDHTERMLAQMGAALSTREGWLELDPPRELAPTDFIVPGDPSSAAFFCAMGVLGDTAITVPDVLANPARLGFVDVLRRMGAEVRMTDVREVSGEAVGTLYAAPSELTGTEIVAEEVPSLIDELPILAIAGARARGVTTVSGAAELRVKESDRIAVIVAGLRALGVAAEEQPDGLIVEGTTRTLRGLVRTAGDHRIAMSFAILAAVGIGRSDEISVDEIESAEVSFPGFGEVLTGAW